MSTRLLRAAVSNDDVGLRRVTAIVRDDPDLEDVLVGAYSRFVLVGADGVRLHEEVLYAGGWMPDRGRFRRLENLTTLRSILDRALTGGTAVSEPVWSRVVERWPRATDGLLAAIEWRTRVRLDSLRRALADREDAERKRITATIDQFSATLHAALAQGDTEDALFSRADASTTKDEREQYRRDRRMWDERLSALAAERERELEAITARYRSQEPHGFPVAVVFVVPKREAIR